MSKRDREAANKFSAALEGLTPEQQRNIGIATNLAASILQQVVENIRKGNVPDEWDGFEIREYLARLFANEAARLDRSSGRYRRFRQYYLYSGKL